MIQPCARILRIMDGPYNVWLKMNGPRAICLQEITLA